MAILVATCFSVPALAGRIDVKKKWALDETEIPGTGTVCVASTSVKENKATYSLEVQKIKNNPASPVEILLRESGETQLGPVAVKTVNNEVLVMTQMSEDKAAQTNYFWYLPDETELTLYTIKTQSEFDMRPFYKSVVGDIDFSLKGAAEIMALMEKRCNNGQPLVDARFAALTNHPDSFDQNLLALPLQSVMALRSDYFGMGVQYANLVVAEADMAKLVQRYKPSIDERDILSAEKSRLVGQTIPGIKADQSATSLRLAQTQSRLNQLKTEIPAASRQQETAQKNYDTAYRNIAPHMPTHNQLVAALDAAQSNLSRAQNDLNDAVNEFNANERRVIDLDREAANLSYQIRGLRTDLSAAGNELSRRDRDYRAFQPERERRERLARQPMYAQRRREADSLRGQANQAQQQLTGLQRSLAQARSALNHCAAKPGANCQAEQAAVARAQQAVTSKQAEVNQLQSRYRSAQADVDRIENQVNREVQQEESRLRQLYETAQRRYDEIGRRIDTAEAKRRDIVEMEIPQLRNRNVYLDSLRRSLESDIVRLRGDVASARSQLDSFDARVGYQNLKNRLDAADNALRSANNHLASLQDEQVRLQNLEVQDQNHLIQLGQDLSAAESRLAQVNTRIGQLNAILAEFDRDKLPIQTRIDGANGQINSLRTHYLSLLQ